MGIFDMFKSSKPASGNNSAANFVTKTFPNGVYVGEWKDNSANGYGTFRWNDGEKYEGEWLNGKRHGQGVYWMENGDQYAGEWKLDKKDGQGVYTYADGCSYAGSFVQNKWNGYGVYRFANGNVCECEWRDGQKNGHGKEIFTDGDVFEGDYVNGKRNGHGIYYFSNGNKFEGVYVNGERHGRGVFTYADNDFYVGNWVDGSAQGEAIFTHMDGRVEKLIFDKGVIIDKCLISGAPVEEKKSDSAETADETAELSEADLYYEKAEKLYDEGKSEESIVWYEKAAELGDAGAMNTLGWCYLHGEGVDVDLDTAAMWLKKAIANGSHKAAGNLATAIVFMDYDMDIEEIMEPLINAAKADRSIAFLPLGDCYYRGCGVEENAKLAAYWVYRAYKEDYAGAYEMMGHFFADGYYFPKVPSMAKYCYLKAEENGLDVEQYLNGDALMNIDPVEPIVHFDDKDPDFFDMECPCQLYSEAVELLFDDEGEHNKSQRAVSRAYTYLRESAKQGFFGAQWLLGEEYLDEFDEDATCESCSMPGKRNLCRNEGLDLLIKAANQGCYRSITSILTRWYEDSISISDALADNLENMKSELFQGTDPYEED